MTNEDKVSSYVGCLIIGLLIGFISGGVLGELSVAEMWMKKVIETDKTHQWIVDELGNTSIEPIPLKFEGYK